MNLYILAGESRSQLSIALPFAKCDCSQLHHKGSNRRLTDFQEAMNFGPQSRFVSCSEEFGKESADLQIRLKRRSTSLRELKLVCINPSLADAPEHQTLCEQLKSLRKRKISEALWASMWRYVRLSSRRSYIAPLVYFTTIVSKLVHKFNLPRSWFPPI